MKKILLILLIIPSLVNSQISFLDKKNGYKDIKFGTDVRNYDYIKKAKKTDETTVLSWKFVGKLMYEKRLNYGSGKYIVDLTKIKSPHPFYLTKVIWVETYNNLIFRITIIVDGGGQSGYAGKGVYNRFVDLLGPPEMEYSGDQPGLLETTTASWKAENVELRLNSIHNSGPSPIINGVPYYYLKDKRRIGWQITFVDIELNYKNIVDSDVKSEKRKLEELKKMKDKF